MKNAPEEKPEWFTVGDQLLWPLIGMVRVITVFDGLPITKIEGHDRRGCTGHGRWKVPARWTALPSTGPWTSPSDAHTFHRPDGDLVVVSGDQSDGARALVTAFPVSVSRTLL
jgi:hypothetical protein